MHVGELLRDDGLDYFAELEERRDDMMTLAVFLSEVQRGAPGTWAERAACKGQTAVMFPSRGDSLEPAHKLCDGCSVYFDCLEWAAGARPDQHGIIAHTSFRQRQELRN